MFDELFTGVDVAIDTERCLNTRHERAGCQRCVDACPTNAISITGHLPVLAGTLCVHCGACTPVCPTDAVVDSDLAERRLVHTCAALDSTFVTVACALHNAPGPVGPTGRTNGNVVIHGRCLGSLSSVDLLMLSTDTSRSLTLDLSQCVDCPIGVAADVVIAESEQTNALISAFAGPDAKPIRLHGLPTWTGDELEVGTAVITDSRRPARSRRGLFSSLRRHAASVIERTRQEQPPPLRRTKGAVPKRLPHSLPASRRHLLELLSARAIASPAAPRTEDTLAVDLLPMASIRIDPEACSGCELCARYCPTAALTFDATTDLGAPTTFSLDFQATLCIDCEICTIACPEDAITTGDTIAVNSITSLSPAVLVSGQLVACSGCGCMTASHGGSPESRCFSCRLGSGVVTSLRDDAGLMADLIKRTPGPSEA